MDSVLAQAAQMEAIFDQKFAELKESKFNSETT
jgi:hypothetical protein